MKTLKRNDQIQTAIRTELETSEEKPMKKESTKEKEVFPTYETGMEAAEKELAEKRKTKEQMLARKAESETAVGKGRKYEAQAAAYVEGMGYRIRERNFRCRQGEIDLIAQKEDALFFIEVKGQKKDWQAEQKINAGKKQRILAASVEYLRQENLWQRCAVHYDVIIITGQEIRYYADAFEW